MRNIKLTFCTYFQNIEKFQFAAESYEETVAFCVRRGAFRYRIDEEKEETVCGGEVVFCPPNRRFFREIIEPTELCMIKFEASGEFAPIGAKVRISNLKRWDEDLSRLERCLFCRDLNSEAEWAHYCMDILYLAADSTRDRGRVAPARRYIEENYARDIKICELAREAGYSLAHFNNSFKELYGVTPKLYLSQIRIIRAKEMLLTTGKLSREVAFALGFADELYFIRFFKKHTGMTPRQFRESGI